MQAAIQEVRSETMLFVRRDLEQLSDCPGRAPRLIASLPFFTVSSICRVILTGLHAVKKSTVCRKWMAMVTSHHCHQFSTHCKSGKVTHQLTPVD